MQTKKRGLTEREEALWNSYDRMLDECKSATPVVRRKRSGVRPTNLTPREHYEGMLSVAQSRGEVSSGPLGIPGWRKVRKSTAKWMIQQGKWAPTEQNLALAGMSKAPKRKVKTSTDELLEKLKKLQSENEGLRAVKLGE
jgi:hypothetical protein